MSDIGKDEKRPAQNTAITNLVSTAFSTAITAAAKTLEKPLSFQNKSNRTKVSPEADSSLDSTSKIDNLTSESENGETASHNNTGQPSGSSVSPRSLETLVDYDNEAVGEFSDKLCYKYIDHKFFKKYVDTIERQSTEFCNPRIQIEYRLKEFIAELPPPQVEKDLWKLLWNDTEPTNGVAYWVKKENLENPDSLDINQYYKGRIKIGANVTFSEFELLTEADWEGIESNKKITDHEEFLDGKIVSYNFALLDKSDKEIEWTQKNNSESLIGKKIMIYRKVDGYRERGTAKVKTDNGSSLQVLLKQEERIRVDEIVEFALLNEKDEVLLEFRKKGEVDYDSLIGKKIKIYRKVDGERTPQEVTGVIWETSREGGRGAIILHQLKEETVDVEYNIEYEKLSGRKLAKELKILSDENYADQNKSWMPRLIRKLFSEMEDPENAINSMVLVCALVLTIPFGFFQYFNSDTFDTIEHKIHHCRELYPESEFNLSYNFVVNYVLR